MTKVTTTTMITAMTTMLEYDFMRNAFAAAGVAAVVSGLVGYFLVLRGQTFAGHALSHIGFAGATGAVLIGVAPVWGLVGFTVAAGDRHGAARRAHQRPRRRHRRGAGAGARLWPAVSALLHVVRYPGDGAAVRQRARRRPRHDRHPGRARPGHARRARRDHAAADFRELAAGTGRGQGRAAALCVHRFPDRRRPWPCRSARRSSASSWSSA